MRYEDTVRNVAKILTEYTMKLTLRQIYYRLVADYGLPNKRSSYNQLSRHLVKARENRTINENRIEDRTRSFLGGEEGYKSPDGYLETLKWWLEKAHDNYDILLWEAQDVFVIIWVEKDALSRVIQQASSKYRVIVCPSRGYASFTYIRQAVARVPSDKKVIVLHFADHDPSGLDMTRDLQERLWRYGASNATVVRKALTYEQTQEMGLMPNPTKLADPRSPKYMEDYGSECWELDAIDPETLQQLVLEAVEEHVDAHVWQESLDRLEEEREEVKETIDKWREAIDEVD